MKTLRLYNRIIGWGVFIISAFVYFKTLEPTTSLWDCGEFIASAYKLQVGHPPGAPLFMILARLFSLFAGSESNVALMINALSGLASAFTILFLFWSITHLALKLVKNDDNDLKTWQIIAILGSSLVGSLAYTFSDTFWFSAVEGEVYASSSLFTALVFWAILKWENVASEKYANKWLILIAYLMGLSIGVHLLNLLAIPAIVLVYYFKKYRYSRKGIIGALLIALMLLGGIMYVIIPGVVWMASMFELLFVNVFGLKYNSGVLFYSALLIGGLVFGIHYTHKYRKVLANTIIIGITVIILGYSSFSMIVIRSLANPPMDENSPETVFALMYYLNREQYGDRPLIKGQYFNAPRPEYTDSKPTYTQIDGKYVITNRKPNIKYDSDFTTFFPRMYSSKNEHIRVYLDWGGIEERDVYYPRYNEDGSVKTNRNGDVIYDRNNPKAKPSFISNIRFFLGYQLGHMYFRYFMWNFAGRQNNIQADGGPLDGNWISGIEFIDQWLVGEGKGNMPDEIKNHPARNTYYFLPLLLGIIGLIFQYSKHKKDFSIVMLLFVLTGIAVVVYLNQTPIQPRERDYAYAGSFYAFAIWIGLGVLGIIDLIGKKARNLPSVVVISLICLFLVPGIMARENWDDHDRSGRYLARDIAYDYLNSCEPNAILFTGGDNDTFPLWYAQEVEGIRTDVRVVNLMLLNMDWYIDQMKLKAYESDPLPISLKIEQYINGTRDAVPIYEQEKYKNIAFPAKDIVEFIGSDSKASRLPTQSGEYLDYVPVRKFILPVDTALVIGNETVKKENASQIESPIGRITGGHITKSNLIALDIIANNDWERPVYFVGTNHTDDLGLSDYVQLDGLAYRLVPIKTSSGSSFEHGRVDADILHDKLMNVFKYGRMNEEDVFLDNFHIRTLSVVRLRFRFTRLADALINRGDFEKAEKVLDRIIELTPHEKIPYHMFMPGIADSYYRIGKYEKGNEILNKMLDISDRHLEYYFSFKPKNIVRITGEIEYHMRVIGNIIQITQQYKQTDLASHAEEVFDEYSNLYSLLR
ncbi:MAG: DUF2723 domain-containing protein [Bacteroidales bacterium]|nr:DUF2723 domain-containing protein [Bacteroidales bacterium]